MALRVVKVGDGEDGEAWSRALADGSWVAASAVLKDEGDVCVRGARVMDRDVVVKRWGLSRLKRRVQARLDATPACRHWRGAELLKEAGIRTAACRVLARGRDDAGACELLVMERLEGRTLLQAIADGDLTVRQEHRLAEAIGRQLGEMYVSAIGNRDHKASNVMVLEPPADAPERGQHVATPALIDCVGVGGPCRPFQEEFSLLVECIGTNHAPRRSLRMRVLVAKRAQCEEAAGASMDRRTGREVIRNAWHGVAERLERHGDPTPRVDPGVARR